MDDSGVKAGNQTIKQALLGKRIAVAGGRRFAELKTLIENLGGEAVSYPMMGSSPNDKPEVGAAIKALCQTGTDWLIVVTGVGTKALIAKAEALGLAASLQAILKETKIAARGYKTLKALKALQLTPQIQDDDGTLEGLRRQLEPHDFANKRVYMQLHGEPMPELKDWLVAQGAEVHEIPLYFYDPPEASLVQQLVLELVSRKIAAVAFTSNTQVKFFFAGAKRLGAEAFVKEAFEDVVALSVGSMTSAALKAEGIKRIVAPEHERMGAMIMALADYVKTNSVKTDSVKTEIHLTNFPVVLTKLRQVVVVGGGKVAQRKVKSLQESGVVPKVISPTLTSQLAQWQLKGKIEHLKRSYKAGDLKGAELVLIATNQPEVNLAAAAEAERLGILYALADNPQVGNLYSLGSVRRGDLLIGVSTSGKSPSLARYLRADLAETFSQGYTGLLVFLAEQRSRLNTLDDSAKEHLLEMLTTAEVLEKFAANPETAKHACLLLMERYFKERVS